MSFFFWMVMVWLVVGPVAAYFVGRGIRIADVKEGTADPEVRDAS